jgi:hypothetical protein
LKAYLILDIIDLVAWAAVIFLVAQGNIQNQVSGVEAVLGWGVFALAVQLM